MHAHLLSAGQRESLGGVQLLVVDVGVHATGGLLGGRHGLLAPDG